MCKTPLGCIPDKIRMSCNVQRAAFNFQRPTENVSARPLLHDDFVICRLPAGKLAPPTLDKAR
jgi:hypothetical protein